MDSRQGEKARERAERGRGFPFWLPAVAAFLLLCAVALPAQEFLPEEDPDAARINAWIAPQDDRGAPLTLIGRYEDVWDIEDTHQEEPGIVHHMFAGKAMLGEDAAQRIFYCALGPGLTDAWPELALSAAGEEGLQAALLDDYRTDDCSLAVREGYSYNAIAWTDTAYEYVKIVFTGLPVVSVRTEETPIGDSYIPAEVHIAAGAEDAFQTRAAIHTRGGGFYRGIDKFSYRLEFRTLNKHGREVRRTASVLGMEADTDWLLVGNPFDETAVRNQLCWELWRDWTQGRGINVLESRLCELFLNGEYQGLYQIMQRIDPEKELAKMGGSPQTDIVGRYIRPNNKGWRPRQMRSEYMIELRSWPEGMEEEEAFAAFEDLIRIREQSGGLEDPEAFAALVQQRFDMADLMDFFLFTQATSLGMDNVNNNVWLWALRQPDGGLRYRLSPWDMDAGFLRIHTALDGSTEDELNMWMTWINRVLNRNIGNSRALLAAEWAEKRGGVLSNDALYERISEMEERVNASGAYLRETEKWRGGGIPLDLENMKSQALEHMDTIQYYLDIIWGEDDPIYN